jgi:hypothetical protein
MPFCPKSRTRPI